MSSVIGKIVRGEFTPHKDIETDAQVLRLTCGTHTCHHIYPTMRSTTSDGMFLLHFRELGRRRQLYAMNLETGDSLQLTSGRDVDDYHAAFSCDDRHIFFLQANTIWKMDALNLIREELYRPRGDWKVREFNFTDDDRYMVTCEVLAGGYEVSLSGLTDWSTFALDSLRAPRNRIVLIDLQSGEASVLVDEECWLGRPCFRPGDPTTIMYCHEGPYDMIDARMWLVQSDGTSKRCCRSQDNDTVLTSEFWFPDGSELGFLCWRPHSGEAEELHAIDPVTLEERTVCTCPAYAHCAVGPNGKLIVGDALSTNDPVHIHASAVSGRVSASGEDDDFIYLSDLGTGEAIRLCHHGSSYLPKYGRVFDSEPHPVFSRDGRSIIYVSDAEGRPSIYRVKLARFLWERAAKRDESYAYGITATF